MMNYRDRMYRWILQNRNGQNEMHVEMTAPVNGQWLIANLPKVVSINMVTDGIDFALENGWTPEQAAEPFRCKCVNKKFFLLSAEDRAPVVTPPVLGLIHFKRKKQQ